MLEGMSKRMGEAGKRVAEADAETLWTMIQTMASGMSWNESDDPFTINNFMLAAAIIRISEFEHWTPLRTALALAYAHMVLSNDHFKDLVEVQAFMQRPMVIHQHCEGCTCKDKITRWEDAR
jgi:hypothetical protein